MLIADVGEDQLAFFFLAGVAACAGFEGLFPVPFGIPNSPGVAVGGSAVDSTRLVFTVGRAVDILGFGVMGMVS